MKTTRALKFDF